MENLILTTALPYANGDLHIGHLYEAVIADVKSRTYTAYNKKHSFLSGADCHGSATTLYCQKHNLNIENHLYNQIEKNKKVYKHFDVSFIFSQTNTILHHFVVNECLDLINKNGKKFGNIIETKNVFGWFDEQEKQFLPDRYIKAKCPHCLLENQVEICDGCQKVIENKDLINPQSILTNNKVVLKPNKHLVLNTTKFYDNLLEDKEKIPESIRDFVLTNKNTSGYIDISRERPYYGINIDKEYVDIKDQCFYVWFDAPIAYITFAYEQYLLKNQIEHSRNDFRKFIKTIKFEHFIGKDIIYFHTYLWFNILKYVVGKNIVEKINIHGWITSNKEKFSKRNGAKLNTEISLKEVREYRLFFFSKFNGTQSDIEFNVEEIKNTYTSLVINKFGNFYTRSVKLLEKHGKFTLNKVNESTLSNVWLNGIEKGDYRNLYVWLDEEITKLNINFSTKQLWKEEDSKIVKESLKIWINKWNELFTYLCIIIPEFNKYKESVNNLDFFYLDKR